MFPPQPRPGPLTWLFPQGEPIYSSSASSAKGTVIPLPANPPLPLGCPEKPQPPTSSLSSSSLAFPKYGSSMFGMFLPQPRPGPLTWLFPQGEPIYSSSASSAKGTVIPLPANPPLPLGCPEKPQPPTSSLSSSSLAFPKYGSSMFGMFPPQPRPGP